MLKPVLELYYLIIFYSSPLSYSAWNPGEPNGGTGSNCLTLYKGVERWDDVPCHAKYGYICERSSANN